MLIDVFHINIHYRKVGTELNELIQPVGQRARVYFRKMMLTAPTFVKNFDFIWALNIVKLNGKY